MSDMDLEKAREIVENHEKSHYGKVILLCPSAACIGAQGFLEGHASRDPEVAELKEALAAKTARIIHCDKQIENLYIELSTEHETVEKLKAENRRLEAQQKAWRGTLFCNGEAYRPYATPEGGVVPILEPVKVTKILDELSSEREASRKLVEAAEDTIGERMLGQIDPQMRSRGLDKIEEALRFYATPGHSPEGKTL